jgi:GTP-binding protein
VVLLFIDPKLGISRLDKQLADYIGRQYKPFVFVVNKWDLMVDDPTVSMQKYANLIQHAFRSMPYAPMAFITAKTGKNVKALLNLSQSMFKQARRRVGTGTLNRIVREAVDAHPPVMRENRTPRVYYATQVGTSPPTIVVFVNKPSLFDPTYLRYLLNVFREKLPFHDIPVKLYLRSRTKTDLTAMTGLGTVHDPTADEGPQLQRAGVGAGAPVEAARSSDSSIVPAEPPLVSDIDREVNELLSDFEE